MNRDDIIRMAREAGLCIDGEVAFSPNHNGADVDINDLQAFAALVAAAEREKVAHWMMTACYATEHGDTTEDLLRELAWQADERIAKAVAAEREACAKVCESLNEDWNHLYVESCAFAIRERGAP